MTLSTLALAKARDAAAAILDELGLDAYLFEVEPRDGDWELRVECAVNEGWENVVLRVPAAELQAAVDDEDVRARLRRRWGEALAACRRAGEHP